MKCPKKFTCKSYYCARHAKQEHLDTPVHEPCKWFFNYENQQIRKQKIMKINGK